MTQFFQNLDWSILIGALITAVPALLCISLHELAHGYTAYRLGDPTAKMMGRLTLNPLKHIDPIGLLMMVVVRFGWAKPVPVNMSYFKKPKLGMAITAIAGPISNIIIAFFFILVLAIITTPLANSIGVKDTDLLAYRYLTNSVPESVSEFFYQLVSRAAHISIILAVFNLFPIPPLDGSKVLLSFLPEQTYYKLMKYERFGFIILVLLMFTDFFQSTIGHLTSILFFTPLQFLGVISPEFYTYLIS